MQRRALLAALIAPIAGPAPGQTLRERWQARREATARSPDSSPSVPSPGATVSDTVWIDTQRGRRLPLRLRLPAGSAPAALVLFSHGLGGNLDAGTRWAEAWATAGIATLHLQHPGSDTEVLRQGGWSALKRAANASQLQARAGDLRFVLDELGRRQRAGEGGLHRLRLDAVGVAGHSFGAHTTLAVAGQRLGRMETGLADPRPRAFAAFSPSPGPDDDPGDAFAAIRRPVLCLTGSRDVDALGATTRAGTSGRETDGRWRRRVYDGLPAGHKAELWLEDADHATFSGAAPAPGSRRTDDTLRWAAHHDSLIRQQTTAWWRAHLSGDEADLQVLRREPQGLRDGDAWRHG